MQNRTKTFIKWWSLFAVLYSIGATVVAVMLGFFAAWSFGMSGSYPSLFRSKLIFPTQLVLPLPERFDIPEVFMHAVGSGVIYAFICVSIGALCIKNSE